MSFVRSPVSRSLSPGLVGALLLSALASLPAAAQGALGPGGVGSGKGTEEPFPLHATASLTQSVGAGTFVPGPTNNPMIQTSLTLQPTVVYKGFVGFVSQSYAFEWTDSDTTTTKNQVELSDLAVGLRYQGFTLPEYDIIFSVGGGAQLPMSMASRQAGSVGALQLSGRTTYYNEATGLLAYGALNTGYTILVPALSQRFAKPNSPEGVDQIADAETLSCIVRNVNELNNYACGTVPNRFFWRAGAGGSWTGLDGILVVSLDLSYQQSFSAFQVWADDEFTADNAVTGLVPRQSTSANIGVTWVAQPWVFLTAGAQTFSPLWSADGKHPRFPLWDFESTRENNSLLYLDATFQY